MYETTPFVLEWNQVKSEPKNTISRLKVTLRILSTFGYI